MSGLSVMVNFTTGKKGGEAGSCNGCSQTTNDVVQNCVKSWRCPTGPPSPPTQIYIDEANIKYHQINYD